MKLVFTMKDAREIHSAVHRAAREQLLDVNEAYKRREEICEKLDKYVEDRDRIHVEFDVDAGTMRVLTLEEFNAYDTEGWPT